MNKLNKGYRKMTELDDRRQTKMVRVMIIFMAIILCL